MKTEINEGRTMVFIDGEHLLDESEEFLGVAEVAEFSE